MDQDSQSSDVAVIDLLTPGGEAVTVRLGRDGRWSGNDQAVVDHLNDFYGPEGQSGPARGDYGVQEAELASARFDGRLRLIGRDRPDAARERVH